MNRWDWMAVRAYLPGAAALLVAVVAVVVISGWQENPLLSGMVSTAKWLPILAIGFALFHGVFTSIRLWRAEHGNGLLCECGGLLGGERKGRYGLYRRCLQCSRNVNSRHYQ